MNGYLLEMNHIAKVYGNGVVANSDVSFNLKKGEIHALVGENGAGKSTLMKILFGMETPSRGTMSLKGELVNFTSSREAIEKGIGMVHQHFMLVESFSVAQNIVLGMEPGKYGFVNNGQAEEFTRKLSQKYNLKVNPKDVTKTLAVGVKQKVEILKALARGAEILILDEPTAVLAPQETKQLFDELQNLKKQGHTIVFISHKIPEIKQISDRITVMRNGKTVGTYDCGGLTGQEISNLIMGSEMDTSLQKKPGTFGKTILCAEGISYQDKNGTEVLKNVSFGVKSGMIFGIAGVQGNGQTELVDLMTKGRRLQRGKILFEENDMENRSISDLRKSKFGYIPEDRLAQGVSAKESVQENMISNRLGAKAFCRHGFLNFKNIRAFVERNIKSYEIRCTGENQPVGMLSGGNMQKVVVARECGDKPHILIAEQPTRGVDVGAAHIIHKKILELRENGCAVLLVSADLSEVLKLSDVVAVMYDGEMTAYFEQTEGLDEETLGLYMLGIEKHQPEEIRKAVNQQ